MCPLNLYLLGSPRLEKDGQVVHLSRRKSLALMAYLAVNPIPRSRDSLATLFWPDNDQTSARANLRRTLFNLQKHLDNTCLDIQRESIQVLCSPELSIDVLVFKELVAQWRKHSHSNQPCPGCMKVLKQAVDLYSGDFLAGFSLSDCPAFDDWVFFENQSLRDNLVAALAWITGQYLLLGEYENGLSPARHWVSLDPLHEPAQRQLMRLYALCGQRTTALRQYAECEKVLEDELGISPDDETQALYQAILNRQELAKPVEPDHKGDFQRRYQLKEELGRGGMSVVYRAHDTLLERDVAFKLLDRSKLGTEGQARLMREARAIARISHPNIRAVYDAGELDGAPYLVLELVEGQTLRDKIDAPLEDVLRWMLQVCDALEHAHQHGILHRDLKPENVFISTNGRVHLADFGLARQLEAQQLTQTGMLVGTPAYVAPEQLRGEDLDRRADLYSLGVMLYEIAAGGLPFEGETLVEFISQHLNVTPSSPRQFNPQISTELETLILELLSKQPEERPTTALEVSKSIEKILAGETAKTPPQTDEIVHPSHNLPIQPIPFVGREDLLGEIKLRLDDPACRLLTLVGPGGSGKTRLALEAGARQLENYEHGVFFVQLEPLESVDGIVPAIAEATGFRFYEGVEPKQQILNYLEKKSMLLIMDNFEHLLEGVDIVTDILKTAPGVRIMATSRARLNVLQEHLFEIRGMDYPDELLSAEEARLYSAIHLFEQSAARVQSGFKLNKDNLEYVIHICQMLEGMPLGILLASSWLRMLSSQETAAEIERSMDFLLSDLRDIPDRQRSMRAVFDHSWLLLGEEEQTIFKSLSVFCGGFTREAAQQVAGASLRQLMGLVNKSLTQRDASGRFSMHRLLREYGNGKLEEDPAGMDRVRDLHSEYYCNKLAAWEQRLKSAGQMNALSEMDLEIENCRAAWERAVEHTQMAQIKKTRISLYWFLILSGRYLEGESVFRLAYEPLDKKSVGNQSLLLTGLLARWVDFSTILGHVELAKELNQHCQALLDKAREAGDEDKAEEALILNLLADQVAGLNWDHARAREWNERSLAICQEIDDRWLEVSVLSSLMDIYYQLGLADHGKRAGERIIALARELGDQRGMVRALTYLANVAPFWGEYEESLIFFQEAIDISRAIGDRAGCAFALQQSLSILGFYFGDFNESLARLEEALQIYEDLGMKFGVTQTISFISWMRFIQGHYEQGREDGEKTLVLAHDLENLRLVLYGLELLCVYAMLHDDVERAGNYLYEALSYYKAHEPAEMEEAPLLAYQSIYLCRIDRALQAREPLTRVLSIYIHSRNSLILLHLLPAIAFYKLIQGNVEQAVELYALLGKCWPGMAKARILDDLVGKQIKAAAAGLPPEVVGAAQARGRARDPWQTAEELLEELESQIKGEDTNI